MEKSEGTRRAENEEIIFNILGVTVIAYRCSTKCLSMGNSNNKLEKKFSSLPPQVRHVGILRIYGYVQFEHFTKFLLLAADLKFDFKLRFLGKSSLCVSHYQTLVTKNMQGSHSTWKTWKNESTPGKPENIMEF